MSGESHVAALVRRDGRPIKRIERDAGLTEGAIGYYLKPSSPDRNLRIPRLDVMERFAEALGHPLEDITQAFIRDAGLATGAGYTVDEVELIQRYRALPECDKARLRDILQAFEDHPHAAARHSQMSR